MTESRPSDILMEIIRTEEERILASLPGERRWGLLELVRAVDHYFVYVLGLDGQSRDTEIQSDRWDLFNYGQSKAVSLFTDRSSIASGPSLTKSTRPHQQWADAVIQNCGKLGICEMIVSLHRYGLVELSMPSPKVIHATVSNHPTGIEAVEADDFHVFQEMAMEIDQPIRDRNKDIAPDVMALMSPLVSPWQEHFIQYNTNPDIDVFFRNQGLLWARARYEPGQDAFPPHAVFGGLPFVLYRESVVEVMGWVLKHIAFTKILLSRNKGLDIRNLLTVTAGQSQLQGYLSAAFDIDENEARQVLGTMTTTPDNIQAHASAPAVYIAPFLSINADSVIFSITGALGSPFDVMLAELYRRYRSDWDHAVDEREEYFRKELYDLFPTQRFAKAQKPLKLKNQRTVATDVDAAVFDRATGTLGLFQLKWQDPFGTSMRKRQSKMANFLRETNRWVATVDSMLIGNSRALGHILEEMAVHADDVKTTLLFVIGRHFSHFSGEPTRDSRAAWGTWPQVLRLLRELQEGSDPVTWLYQMLKDRPPSSKALTLEAYEMRIGGYSVRYDPVPAPRDSTLGR